MPLPFSVRRSVLLGASAATLFLTACGQKSEETESAPAVTDAVAAPPAPAPAAPETAPALTLESIESRASYGVGYNIGMNIGPQLGIEVDPEALAAGLEDAIGAKELRIEESLIEAAFMELERRAQEEATLRERTNLAQAAVFLEENAKRPEVTVTGSGLQYEVLEAAPAGESRKPTAVDSVEVHYHGTLIDGTVFDSSVNRGETITFPVLGVIPGWTEALQLMTVGDRWKLYLPPPLAYGSRAMGSIPANSTLIFEVELINVIRPEAPGITIRENEGEEAPAPADDEG